MEETYSNQHIADSIHLGIANVGMRAVEAGDKDMELYMHAIADAFDELCDRVGLENLFQAAPRIHKKLLDRQG